MTRAPEPFYSISDLIELHVFGNKSHSHIRRIAQLQQKDPTRYAGKVRLSWTIVHSYPRFVTVGGRWGLYASELAKFQSQKIR